MFALRTSKAARDINRMQVDHVKEQWKGMEMCFLVIENMFCAVFVFLCTGLSKHRWEREIPNTVAGEREKERQANHTLGFGLRKSRGRERERERERMSVMSVF